MQTLDLENGKVQDICFNVSSVSCLFDVLTHANGLQIWKMIQLLKRKMLTKDFCEIIYIFFGNIPQNRSNGVLVLNLIEIVRQSNFFIKLISRTITAMCMFLKVFRYDTVGDGSNNFTRYTSSEKEREVKI